MVGGENTSGGLSMTLSMLARGRKEINIFYLMPLYPMIDNLDTTSSVNNHGKGGTLKNHFGWKMYLRKRSKSQVIPYATPTRQTNYHNLPPTYTFVAKN